MTKLHLLAALLSAALAGCATTSGVAPRESRSGFDGARVVTIEGHGNACQTMLCTGLGAQWTSARPESAILSVYVFSEIRGITGAQVSVDALPPLRLTPLPGLTNFSVDSGVRKSRSDFAVPLATVRQIAGAQRAWLRVQTTNGYIEDAIVDGSVDSHALHALRRFLAQVDVRP